ncbi:WhiB family transcriptional regulator [Streptomyces sp. NPDC056987]|uniref:WhiB family transcriptional regulator n=1 Tax=Streptomyces sp. NPDC056987 TaxID=3345988 RepID=UPI00362F7725
MSRFSSSRWRLAAACLPFADLFIPDGEGRESSGEANRRNREAKVICVPCPVRRECLSDALRTERTDSPYQRAVVRGGMSPHQRATLSAVDRERLILEGQTGPSGPR